MSTSGRTNAYRRVVTGHTNGKAVVLSDEQRPAYRFSTVPGFEQTYIWATNNAAVADPRDVDRALPSSALPRAGGSILHVVTFPPESRASEITAESSEIAAECIARLPGLGETFDRSQMHATSTVDYGIVLSGELWMELDDGETVHLNQGDIVVQQATRHGWRNKGDRPATIAFVMHAAR